MAGIGWSELLIHFQEKSTVAHIVFRVAEMAQWERGPLFTREVVNSVPVPSQPHQLSSFHNVHCRQYYGVTTQALTS